jgi:hypothetical protein
VAHRFPLAPRRLGQPALPVSRLYCEAGQKGGHDGGRNNTSHDRKSLTHASGRGQVARSRIRKILGRASGSVHDRPGTRRMLHCGTTAKLAFRSCRGTDNAKQQKAHVDARYLDTPYYIVPRDQVGEICSYPNTMRSKGYRGDGSRRARPT